MADILRVAMLRYLPLLALIALIVGQSRGAIHELG